MSDDAASGGTPPYDKALDVVVQRVVESPHGERLTRTVAGGALLLLLALIGVALDLPKEVPVLTAMMGFFLLRLAAAPAPKTTKNITKSARVRVSSLGIDVEGAARIPLEAIASAYFQPRAGAPPTVRCLDRSHAILFEAEVAGQQEAEVLLRALGRDVAHHRQSYKVMSPMGTTGFLRLGGFFAAIAAAIAISQVAAAVGAGALASFIATCIAFFVPIGVMGTSTTLDVGTDGLLMRWLGRRRFIPYDAVRSVEKGGSSLRVVLASGKTVTLELAPMARRHRVDEDLERDALQARIEQALEAHRRSVGHELPVRLARGARPVAEWRKELATIRDASGYRQTAMRDEDLWRVVEDASAPEEVRAAAALAVRPAEHAGPRLRVAAETIASPRLRVALETAADPAAEDEALEAALASFAERGSRHVDS